MPRHHRPRDRGLPATPGALDDVDPSLFFGRRQSPGPDRKTLQLCRQVERTLGLVVAGSRDDLLRAALIDSVQPAPDASRLLVTVVPASAEVDPSALLERLQATKGHLRAEVAAAIHRKRAPELTFCVGWSEELTP